MPPNGLENMKLRKLLLPISVSFLVGIASASAGDRLSRSKIPTDLVQWLIKDIDKKPPMLDAEELEDLNKNLKCKLYDLNGDGGPEYLLYIDSTGWCGAGGFCCNYWVVQRTSKGYRLLLEDVEIRVKDSVTKGYRDLTSEFVIGYTSGGWAREIRITEYKFDGKRYGAGRKYSVFRR